MTVVDCIAGLFRTFSRLRACVVIVRVCWRCSVVSGAELTGSFGGVSEADINRPGSYDKASQLMHDNQMTVGR